MPHKQQLAYLRDCEAQAAELGHQASDPEEQDRHFNTAAGYAEQIAAIERQYRATD